MYKEREQAARLGLFCGTMKLLIGINGMENDEVFQELLSELNEYGVQYETCGRRYKKSGIEEYLEQNSDIDVLLISEYLEELYPFQEKDFERILDEHEHIKIIPILTESEKGSLYITKLFHLGIYEGVFQEDASIETIAHLILEGRTRKNAKLYYQIKEEEAANTGANVESCIFYIENAASSEEIIQQAQYVRKRVTLREFDIILGQLEEETLDVLEKSEEFASFFGSSAMERKKLEMEMAKDSNKKRSFPKLTDSLLKLRRFENQATTLEKEQCVKQQVNIKIGVTGLEHGIGVTHQAIVIAQLLANRNYRVAYLQKEEKNRILDTIVQTGMIEKTKDYFNYQGVHYYWGHHLEYLEELLKQEKPYHYIVIDYGVFDDEICKKITQHKYQLVLARGTIWERKVLEQFMKQTARIGNQYWYLLRGGEEKELYTWMEEKKAHYLIVSESSNPFQEKEIEPLQTLFFDSLEEPLKPKKRDMLQTIFQREKMGIFQTSKKKERKEVDVIFVTSLKHGTGATHFSIGAANELSFHGKVCVVHPEASYMENELYEDIEFSTQMTGLRKLHKGRDYLLYDCGCVEQLSEELKEEMKYATYKILMCFSDDDYLEKLAKFVQILGEVAQEWIFIFNVVPKEKISQIERVMNFYDTIYLPIYDLDSTPKAIKKMYQKLFL